MTQLDFDDVQGLVRFGFGGMHRAFFYLVRVIDVAAARAWLNAAHVTTARTLDPPPSTALQVAFTCEGLKALGVPKEVREAFAPEFCSGMSGEESRSRRLGDLGPNHPDNWRWGAPNRIPHLAIMMYGQEGAMEQCEAEFKGPSWDVAFEVLERLTTTFLGDVEPFGFVDGISQPTVDWEGKRKIVGDQLTYSNFVALGEFLLGYSNEYNEYTDRPLLDASSRGASELLPASDQPQMKDLGRNGTYLVMRQLEQHVDDFWRYMDQTTGSNSEASKQLAAAMVGRQMDGTPLVPVQNDPIEGIGNSERDRRDNLFTYDSDPDGVRCPFGAHIRRANPRNADFPTRVKGKISHLLHTLGFARKGSRDDLMSPARFHRLIRRGREYGEGSEEGLHFICLNANIARQFEFVQGAWLISTKFNGLGDESDPVLGLTKTFSRPRENGLRACCNDLPQFVTVRGGAYFFLPSVRALRYFATVGS